MRPPLPSHLLDQLPAASAEALAQSRACELLLREQIQSAGGWLSFADFMQTALYAPGVGYYAGGARKFGRDGDFTTAPELSSLFGVCVANAVAPALAATDGVLLELGPGSGKLAVDVLTALDARDALPEKYWLLEVSADLRERQRDAIAALPAHLSSRCEWIDALPALFDGAVIANEVLDVVPVQLIVFGEAGAVYERGVALDGDDFVWRDMPVTTRLLDAQAARFTSIVNDDFGGHAPVGYLTEIAPAAEALVAAVAQSLRRGVMLWVDYGFRRAEYYHPSRSTGTLMCHYRHHAHPDPFVYPGLTDITAHVDFTSIAEAAVGAGCTVESYSTQAQFLLASGLLEAVQLSDPNDAAQHLRVTNEVNRLMSPAEMGELFKVIAFGKGGVTFGTLQRARQLPL